MQERFTIICMQRQQSEYDEVCFTSFEVTKRDLIMNTKHKPTMIVIKTLKFHGFPPPPVSAERKNKSMPRVICANDSYNVAMFDLLLQNEMCSTNNQDLTGDLSFVAVLSVNIGFLLYLMFFRSQI